MQRVDVRRVRAFAPRRSGDQRRVSAAIRGGGTVKIAS